MLRASLLAVGLAAVAGYNCGGSLSVDPRYCTVKDENGESYCTYNELKVGETVPLRVVVTNQANYEPEGYDSDPVFVPGLLVNGKTIQIAFACLDGVTCDNPSGEALTYSGRYDPKGAASTFAMGEAGADFENINHCESADADKACGTITLTEDVEVDPEETVTIGVVFMTAAKYVEEAMTAHVAATSGFLLTRGGICQPNELSASGAGTAEAIYLGMSPPPPSPPPPPPPQCEICGKDPCYTTCSACAYPWATPTCIDKCPGCEICKICETQICADCVSGAITSTETCAICSSCVECPSPPPPPSPPPEYACVKYNKCHKCDEIPPGACLYAGESTLDGPCLTSCDDLPEEWIFFKKWGACSSACPVSVSKDPHMHLPHGGRADFRGQDNTVFNLLSAKDVTFNVLFEKGDFAWATRLVHGTKMAAGYWVIKTTTGKTLTVEYTAEKLNPTAIVHEDEHRDVQVRAGTPALVVDDVIVSMVGKTLSVRNSKWLFTATTSPYPFGKLEVNKNKVLLDVAVQPLYDPDTDAVAPHGILGQSYDQDKIAVDGKIDEEKTGEMTTTAQAEGAIEGTWEDYIMSGKFSTEFKYARFGLEKAAPRDVTKLTGTKKAATAGAVGIADLSDKM